MKRNVYHMKLGWVKSLWILSGPTEIHKKEMFEKYNISFSFLKWKNDLQKPILKYIIIIIKTRLEHQK